MWQFIAPSDVCSTVLWQNWLIQFLQHTLEAKYKTWVISYRININTDFYCHALSRPQPNISGFFWSMIHYRPRCLGKVRCMTWETFIKVALTSKKWRGREEEEREQQRWAERIKASWEVGGRRRERGNHVACRQELCVCVGVWVCLHTCLCMFCSWSWWRLSH